MTYVVRIKSKSNLFRFISPGIKYLVAGVVFEELAVDEWPMRFMEKSHLAQGPEAAHMIYRLYAEQSESVQYDLKRLMIYARIKHPHHLM
jgi:hypothetical protein